MSAPSASRLRASAASLRREEVPLNILIRVLEVCLAWLHAGQRWLAGVGISVPRLIVGVPRPPGEAGLRAHYELIAPEGRVARLVMRTTQLPVRVVFAEIDADTRPRIGGPVGRGVPVLSVPTGQHWNGRTLRVSLDWRVEGPHRKPEVLLAPDLLPMPFSPPSTVGAPVPLVRFGGDPGIEPLAWIMAHGGHGRLPRAQADQAVEYIQVAFGTRQAERPMEAPISNVGLGPNLARVAGTHGGQRLLAIVSEAQALIERWLGVPSGLVRLLLVAREDLIGVRKLGLGPVVPVEELEGFLPEIPDRSLYRISRSVAGAYWGAGCRLIGERAMDVGGGVRAGLALSVLASLDCHEEVARIQKRYRSLADSANPNRSLRTDRTASSDSVASRIALATFLMLSAVRRAEESPFASLVACNWGRYADGFTVVESLGLAHVDE